MLKTAWQFEHSVVCNADKPFVWSFWTDVCNWERIEGKAVEWIKLSGPFVVGATGATKTPGQDPHHWRITQLTPKNSATIEISLDGAVFYNLMLLESISSNQTLITQRLSLAGPNARNFAEGMRMFEKSAPQGLAKLVKAIEADYGIT